MIRTLLASLALLAAPAALAQATPEQTLARFVELANAGELTTAAGQAILTSEAKAMATDARSNLPAVDKVIPVGADKAAARFVLKGPSGEEADAYFYLEKTAQGWAVAAYRAMALNTMDMLLLNELRKRGRLQPGEQVEKRNLELALSSDSKLRTWFAANRTALDALAGAYRADARDATLEARLLALGLKSISGEGGEVRIVVGGSVDNSVGFLSVGPAGPPKIDPSDHIWVEDLGGGWRLFRTT